MGTNVWGEGGEGKIKRVGEITREGKIAREWETTREGEITRKEEGLKYSQTAAKNT